MTTWITSDAHFGHRKILQYCSRPFLGVEQMDWTIIKNWNEVVKPEDTTWVLGDFSFYSIEQTFNILNHLNGSIKFLLGDHDRWMEKILNQHEQYHYCTDKFEYMGYMHVMKIKKVSITMCHYPLHEWKGSRHGGIDLHGHSHGNTPHKENRYDVGVDVNKFYPVKLDKYLSVK